MLRINEERAFNVNGEQFSPESLSKTLMQRTSD
jgi:hypothetical protein